ncbi:MAG: hypothetical protein K0R55_2325 [Sporomusa sp.]|jgi:predicted DNA-binding protein with PD1-like motif|nr:hypothetical protein [Sporomusa sp.]
MCDVDRLFEAIGEMDRTELAKGYLMMLKENADLRRELQKAVEQNSIVAADLMVETDS